MILRCEKGDDLVIQTTPIDVDTRQPIDVSDISLCWASITTSDYDTEVWTGAVGSGVEIDSENGYLTITVRGAFTQNFSSRLYLFVKVKLNDGYLTHIVSKQRIDFHNTPLSDDLA